MEMKSQTDVIEFPLVKNDTKIYKFNNHITAFLYKNGVFSFQHGYS